MWTCFLLFIFGLCSNLLDHSREFRYELEEAQEQLEKSPEYLAVQAKNNRPEYNRKLYLATIADENFEPSLDNFAYFVGKPSSYIRKSWNRGKKEQIKFIERLKNTRHSSEPFKKYCRAFYELRKQGKDVHLYGFDQIPSKDVCAVKYDIKCPLTELEQALQIGEEESKRYWNRKLSKAMQRGIKSETLKESKVPSCLYPGI